MLNTVLLSGHLTEEKLKQAVREIQEREPPRQFSLIIDSTGGDMKPTLDFVEFLWASGGPKGKLIAGVKIYNAESAAAFIALSVPTYREMRRGTGLGIHRGAVVLEASEFDLEGGKVSNTETIDRFKKHDAYLKKILDQCGLSTDSKSMAELYGSNWLRLSAKECLERGIVTRLF
jgi:ATP-dependent protease ClpP protease subunit